MEGDREKITGKVAQILNARELVINRGEEHGVEIGMRFAVLNTQGGQILDPDTKEAIGEIDVPKVLVKVTRLGDKIAVASTFQTYRTAGGPFAFGGLATEMFKGSEVRYETLRTDTTTYKEELTEEDSYVHIGDPIVEYKKGDFTGWDAAD